MSFGMISRTRLDSFSWQEKAEDGLHYYAPSVPAHGLHFSFTGSLPFLYRFIAILMSAARWNYSQRRIVGVSDIAHFFSLISAYSTLSIFASISLALVLWLTTILHSGLYVRSASDTLLSARFNKMSLNEATLISIFEWDFGDERRQGESTRGWFAYRH